MRFICPAYDRMPVEMLAHSRLYAFPRKPEPPAADGLVLLDSGAYGLAQHGAAIGLRHMARLAEHYQPYAREDGYRCIAPDVYLNPGQTMDNWRWWREQYELPVAPVIQFPKARRLDLWTTRKQAQFYARWEPTFVAVSNPGLRALEAREAPVVCRMVREITGATWLHNLGAGWDPDDLARWRDLDCFDSVDSVAYYTDAREGWQWTHGGRLFSDAPWREIAAANAAVAVQIAGEYE